jgi:hypothetical protein
MAKLMMLFISSICSYEASCLIYRTVFFTFLGILSNWLIFPPIFPHYSAAFFDFGCMKEKAAANKLALSSFYVSLSRTGCSSARLALR